MADAHLLQPGEKFANGRFVLTRPLSRGGMGDVWLGWDERLQEDVALKFLPPEIRGDATALDDLRRETARCHRLAHPNIVRIHDLHEAENGVAFIIMEYVDGPTLASARLQQPNLVLSWRYVRPLLEQLCAALEYAHGEKVIHRDLKPANMMVDSRGRLKLADFGIAAAESDSLSRVSVKHSTSGTLPYMSPQQLAGKPARVTDDLYALGATLYELLTSKPPFYTGDLTHQVLNEAPPPMEERLTELDIVNSIPSDVGAMVMACLAKAPEQRPQSALAIAQWIGFAIEQKNATGALAQTNLLPVESERAERSSALVQAPGPLHSKASNIRSIVAVAVFVAVLALAVMTVMWRSKPSSLPLDNTATPLPTPESGVTPMAHQTPATPAPPPPGQGGAKSGTPSVPLPTSTAPVAGPETLTKLETPTLPPAKAKASPANRPWTNSLGMRFVPVPGTTILFSIWDTRVQDFSAFVQETGYEATPGMRSKGSDGFKQRGDTWQHPGFAQGPTYPVCGVSWEDAHAFCDWLMKKERDKGLLTKNQGYRLPTDAEWSVAVGGDKFPWGNQWPPPFGAGNYAPSMHTDNYAYTSPVGSFAANRYGLFDMGGNVWQWCEDWCADYDHHRVMRGANWNREGAVSLSSKFRSRGDDRNRWAGGGFRCVLAFGN